jgi:putative peptidoglycan lipid II flippase
LALATSIGAWLNFILVLYFAARARLIAPDAELKATLAKLAAAAVALALALALAAPFVTAMLSSWSRFRDESALAVLVVIGAAVYGGLVTAMFGRRWLSLFRGTPVGAPMPPLSSNTDQV